MDTDWQAVRAMMRQVLMEEMGAGKYELAPKWDGGTLVMQPADSNMKSKEIPMEVFFKKITSVREKLRVLEQKINNHDSLSHTDKAEFQQLITRAYGSLTTFNILFRYEEDRFEGQRSE
ncbi:MAG: hypothetical protein IT368_14470 [Candidatus Hydrogenedentes bacterium]|nr:hypothetical protein [Candidatus Hydrogenedentota bacterium]